MTDLLERTTERHRTARDTDMGPAPPPHPPATTDGTPTWPRNAKIIVAILAVVAVASVFAAIVTGGDDTTDPDVALQAQIDDLITERDALLAEQIDLGSQLDDAMVQADLVAAELADVEDELATVTRQMTAANLDAAALEVTRLALVGQRNALADELAAAEEQVTTLETQLAAEIDTTAALDVRIAELSEEVNALVARAVTAETQRDALAAMFPITVDTALAPTDVVGTWDIDWTHRYCEGFTTCGNDPGFDSFRIETTAADTLRVVVDDHFTAGLGRADDGFVAIGRSLAAIPECDGVARAANVSLTVFGVGATMHADGTETLEHLGITVVVSAVATDTCPAGMSAFGAVLTPG